MSHQLNKTALELREQFKNGESSAELIVNSYLAAIEKHDAQIGAFLDVYAEKAREKARLLDQKRASGQALGKLAGVPIAIKDNIHVKEQITTCGSKFLVNYKAPFNATVVDLLEKEDAVIVGKTNLDEFAMGSSTENSALKTTCNPWSLACSPGGSSGGSAAAVAGRLVPLALGSDTGGSVRQPASLCGIVGFKPTYGRVSRYGLVAYGSSLDQIGPLALTTQDAALLMEVIGTHCERDSTSIPEGTQSYLEHMTGNIQGLRIGVPWQFLEILAEEPKQIFLESIERIKNMGAQIIDIDLSILKYSIAVYYILASAEASTNLARFDGIRYGVRSSKAQTLDELYDFSKDEGFGPEVKRRILLGTYVLSSGYQDAYYKKAQKMRTLFLEKYKEAFSKCDLIATPVSPSTAFARGSIKDPLQMYLEDIYTLAINIAGLPAISVPSGFSKQGLPIGLQLIGPQKQDVKVFEAAYAFEKTCPLFSQVPGILKGEH